MLPFSYAIRNLLRRPGGTAQIVLGSAVVALLFMLAAALNAGMERVLNASGTPHNVILLGAGSEESIERSEVAASVPEIAAGSIAGLKTLLGRTAVSGEVHYNGLVQARDGQDRQTLLRGVTPAALWVHQEVRILAGRFPRSGECLVGRLAHHKMGLPEEALSLGDRLRFNGGEFEIKGIFDAPGTVMEAEIWMPLNDLLTYTQRTSLSGVVLALDRAEFADVDLFTKQRLDLALVAMSESDYYAKLARFYRPVRWMAWICAVLIATGAVFGGLNTMHAAFAARIRELGALQAIGYRRRALLASLIQEATFATTTGALLAGTVGLTLLDGITVPFSIGTFSLSLEPIILAGGLGVGVGLGIIGSLPPAWACLRPEIIESLRAA